MSLAFLANGFVIGGWAPQIPLFAARLDLSKAQLGLMILAFGLGAILAMPLVGRVISRIGSKRPTIWLHAAMVPALPLLALAPNVPLAILAVLFAGITTGGLDVAMNANAVSVEQRLQRAIMSSCHGFWSVGGLLGAGLGGPIIAFLGGGAHGLLTGLVVAATLLFVARHLLSDEPEPAPVAAQSGTDGARVGGFASVGKALAIGVVALFAMIPEGAAIDWSAVYLRQELGVGTAASGLAFAAFSAAMAILRFAGDGIRDRFGAVATARGCASIAIVGLLVIGFAPGLAAALVGFALLGIGLSNIVPIAFSAAGNVEGLKAGTGLSMATSIGYSGILIAPSFIGFIAEHTGFAIVYAGLAALLVLVLAASGIVSGADRRA